MFIFSKIWSLLRTWGLCRLLVCSASRPLQDASSLYSADKGSAKNRSHLSWHLAFISLSPQQITLIFQSRNQVQRG